MGENRAMRNQLGEEIPYAAMVKMTLSGEAARGREDGATTGLAAPDKRSRPTPA